MSFITIFIYNLFSLYVHSTLSGVSEPNENPYPTHYTVCPGEKPLRYEYHIQHYSNHLPLPYISWILRIQTERNRVCRSEFLYSTWVTTFSDFGFDICRIIQLFGKILILKHYAYDIVLFLNTLYCFDTYNIIRSISRWKLAHQSHKSWNWDINLYYISIWLQLLSWHSGLHSFISSGKSSFRRWGLVMKIIIVI